MCNYYETNAERYAAETFFADMSEQYNRFLPLLKEGVRILDVGSGSGRDACRFQRLGYQVTALEPSGNLCREIGRVFSGEIVCSDIQNSGRRRDTMGCGPVLRCFICGRRSCCIFLDILTCI